MNLKEKNDLKIEKQVDRVFKNRAKRFRLFSASKKISKQNYYAINIKEK